MKCFNTFHSEFWWLGYTFHSLALTPRIGLSNKFCCLQRGAFKHSGCLRCAYNKQAASIYKIHNIYIYIYNNNNNNNTPQATTHNAQPPQPQPPEPQEPHRAKGWLDLQGSPWVGEKTQKKITSGRHLRTLNASSGKTITSSLACVTILQLSSGTSDESNEKRLHLLKICIQKMVKIQKTQITCSKALSPTDLPI